MRLDYSEKKGRAPAEQRKPVQKNRPRKEPAGLFALLAFVVLLCTFGAGLLAGWFLFGGGRKAPAVAVASPVKKDEAASLKPGSATPDAQLTFYKTLPAGGKGVIGSGLNLKKGAPAESPSRPAPLAAPPAAVADPDSDSGEDRPEARFAVQIASYRDQQDAEKAQSRLSGKGVAAYLLESKLKDNLVWYRVRVGRHLTRTEAEELAGKSGKGAVVVPE